MPSDNKDSSDWRNWLAGQHPALEQLLYEYRRSVYGENMVNKDRFDIEKKILALIADQCRLARIDELSEIPPHPNFIMEYIADRIKTLENKNYCCYKCGEPNDYSLGEYYCADCEDEILKEQE